MRAVAAKQRLIALVLLCCVLLFRRVLSVAVRTLYAKPKIILLLRLTCFPNNKRHMASMWMIALALALCACVQADSSSIVTARADRRLYRALDLPSGMQFPFALCIRKKKRKKTESEYIGVKALLISDPASDTAAAAMDVGAGSFDNPRAVPGLAHFLEHVNKSKYNKREKVLFFVLYFSNKTFFLCVVRCFFLERKSILQLMLSVGKHQI